MAKLPTWIKCEWDYKSTEFDKKGCNGLYIKKIKVLWFGYPIIFLQIIFDVIKKICVGELKVVIKLPDNECEFIGRTN